MLLLARSLPARRTDNAHGLLSAPLMNEYTLRVSGAGRRDALKQRLSQAGVGCEIYYPVPMHQQECFAHLLRVALPVAEQLASEAISIPIFPELAVRELDAVLQALSEFLRNVS